MKTTTYPAPSIGCYLDQSFRNPCKHDVATVELAMSFGYSPDRETLNCLSRCHYGVMRGDDSQLLSEMADEAIDWLNEQETRPFLYWANNGEAGAFGLWPNVEGAREDCGFVSSRRAEYPPEDYEGEWLHVSDHGNATLYVRENGRDTEIWSVV